MEQQTPGDTRQSLLWSLTTTPVRRWRNVRTKARPLPGVLALACAPYNNALSRGML